MLIADVEETMPHSDGGGSYTVSYHVAQTVDTSGGATIDIDFSPTSVPGLNPDEPAERLVSASLDTYTSTVKVVTGAGPVPFAQQEPPPIELEDGSSPSALRMAMTKSPSLAVSAASAGDDTGSDFRSKPVKRILGDLSAYELDRVKPRSVVMQDPRSGDNRLIISDRTTGRKRVAILDRGEDVDSIVVDALSALPVRIVGRQGNGNYISTRFEYERKYAWTLVLTLSETVSFDAKTKELFTTSRRLRNVQIR